MSLCIETFICVDPSIIDELWAKTQTPHLHQRWDLRFTQIAYLPRLSAKQPQCFTYTTRLGLGIEICGEGETVGECERPNGERSSALKFWSADAKSLISEGSGYWRYYPQADGIRFITGYDYSTRWGVIGHYFDQIIFRPFMGWATAWSFDRLRLWIERGLLPETALRAAGIHTVARLSLAATWLYHGIVPKLLFQHVDEIRMLTDIGLTAIQAYTLLLPIGLAEVGMGLALLWFWRANGLFGLTILLMLLASCAVVLASPQFLPAAFNPISLNLGVMALSMIGWLAAADAPSATYCKYK